MFTRPMMHGPAVVRLQELGDLLGVDTGVNDGIFGAKTLNAVLGLQRKLGLFEDGICGPKTWTAIIDAAENKSAIPDSNNIDIVDIRGQHPRPRLYSHKRKWSEIMGVTIHQTGCSMPQNPIGWKKLNAHIGITQSGTAIIVNNLTDMIWHAQKLSYKTIGIEIEGNFCGVDGDLNTLWRGGGGPHNLNLSMKLALDSVFRFLKSEFESNGAEWKYIYAHRQSSRSRRADPGSEIWKNVSLVWAKRLMLNMYDGGDGFSMKNGLPIPNAWNSKYTRRY